MYLLSQAQRRTAARPATETKVWISMAHATQSSTARRLSGHAASLRGQPVRSQLGLDLTSSSDDMLLLLS
jgi:hypothetical protein